MTVRELLQALSRALPPNQVARPANAGALDTICTGVTHDSRRVTKGLVFVALRGLKADGAAFAADALAAGAAAVVSESHARGRHYGH
jgi:UDP-N-acetylmuramoyl-L-alanyl-D-glutamate--2,6-diaminopimelate ligase